MGVAMFQCASDMLLSHGVVRGGKSPEEKKKQVLAAE